jgi:hypothetical protein
MLFNDNVDAGPGQVTPQMVGQREEDYARLYAWLDAVPQN